MEGGGTMQPKDLALRMMLHETFSSSMLLNIFVDKKRHGYLLIQDGNDIRKIISGSSSIATLRQAESLDSHSIQSRMIEIELGTPLNLNDLNCTRNLLSLIDNPMETLIDFDRRSKSLYTNPKSPKKGSRKSTKVGSHPETMKWLVGQREIPNFSLGDPSLFLPVVKISHIETGDKNLAVLHILDSDKRVFVSDPELEMKDEGGVVIWKIDGALLTRQLKVRKSHGKGVRFEGIKYGYVEESQDASPVAMGLLSPKQRWDTTRRVLEALDSGPAVPEGPDLKERLACISMLGDVDSSQGMFNKISGTFVLFNC
jgi:hypothetical protein